MIPRVRYWLRTESVGITLPVGFIALTAIWSLLASFVTSFIYPVLVDLFGEVDPFGGEYGLGFSLLGVEFQPDSFVSEAIAAALLAVVVYVLLVRTPATSEEEAVGLRLCPECFSEIDAEARRCAFCTSSVSPIVEAPEGQQTAVKADDD